MDVTIRDWTFTHWWVRPVVKKWFGIYHKSIVYSGTEHLDWDRPIIFAPSHRNAFSDALCLILPAKYTEKRFIYPLIRADAFGKYRGLDRMLTTFHMFPVYRPRDKVNFKQKNEDVFDQCCRLLGQRRNLLIHPEGNCIPQKRVRPFKKGLARIAFGAETACDFKLGVTIIPVGINYRDITAMREGIHVRYGPPISVADFKTSYRKNPAAGITRLTRTIQSSIKDLTVDIPASPFYSLNIDLLKLNRNCNPAFCDKAAYRLDELQSNQAAVRSLQRLNEKTEHCLEEKTCTVKTLKNHLKHHRMTLDRPLVGASSFFKSCMKGVGFLLLYPLALYGWVNNTVPWLLMHGITGQIKEEQFISSGRMTLGLALFPASYAVQTFIILLISGRWIWPFLYLISLPLSGLVALRWLEHYRNWRQRLRLYLLPEEDKETINKLIDRIFSRRG